MQDNYLGVLPAADPLYAFMSDEVLGRVLGLAVETPVFDTWALHPPILMRYTERLSGVALAGKFYGKKLPAGDAMPSPAYFRALLYQEFHNLLRVRELGFDRAPYRVVRPLAVNERLNYLLVEEFVAGPQLDTVIQAVLAHNDDQRLYARLADLAGFLAQLHCRSATGRSADLQVVSSDN